MPSTVQDFIRRASRMADKTSWTEPRARMTYGDSIVGTARQGGRTVGGVRAGWACREWDGGTRAGDAGDHGDGIGASARQMSRGRRRRVRTWGRADSRSVPCRRRGQEHIDLMENALLTDRTALDVDPGDAQHEVGHGLRRGRRHRWLRQQDATLGENGGAAAIGEQAEVANADEAVGDDVEQEATEKLVDVERHDLHAIGVSVVAPPKTDAAVREAE